MDHNQQQQQHGQYRQHLQAQARRHSPAFAAAEAILDGGLEDEPPLMRAVDFCFDDACDDEGGAFFGDYGEDDAWRSVDMDMRPAAPSLFMPAPYEPPHTTTNLFAKGQSSDDDTPFKLAVSTFDLPPLPKKPSTAEFGMREAERRAVAARGPRAYVPPPVTCWTAFTTHSADAAMDGVEAFLACQPDTEFVRDGYTVTASGTNGLRVVVYTCVRDGQPVTLCRRIAGCVVTFNTLFSALLVQVQGKPTVCAAAASTCHQAAGFTVVASTAMYQCA